MLWLGPDHRIYEDILSLFGHCHSIFPVRLLAVKHSEGREGLMTNYLISPIFYVQFLMIFCGN